VKVSHWRVNPIFCCWGPHYLHRVIIELSSSHHALKQTRSREQSTNDNVSTLKSDEW